MNKKENELTRKTGAGRNLKSDPAIFRHTISLNEEQNAVFLGRFDESGMKIKAHFITDSIFNKPLRVVRLDKSAMDYYMRLTTFYSQFRAIGVNYNQVVKTITTSFPEKKALTMLARLERITIELVASNRQIMNLADELEAKIYGSKVVESLSTGKKKQE